MTQIDFEPPDSSSWRPPDGRELSRRQSAECLTSEVGMLRWLLILLSVGAAAAWCQTVPQSFESKRLSPASGTDKQIQSLQAQTKAEPGNYLSYNALGS